MLPPLLVAPPPDDAPMLPPALVAPPPPVPQPPLPTVSVFCVPVLADPATPVVDPLPNAPAPASARTSGSSGQSQVAACGHNESCDQRQHYCSSHFCLLTFSGPRVPNVSRERLFQALEQSQMKKTPTARADGAKSGDSPRFEAAAPPAHSSNSPAGAGFQSL
jgi:hypothetical protein